jgi:hypothetical protein
MPEVLNEDLLACGGTCRTEAILAGVGAAAVVGSGTGIA